MVRRCHWGLLTVLGAALAVPAVVGGQRSADSDDLRYPAKQEWPAVGGDWGDSRYSTLTQVNTQTVKNLGAAWVSAKFEDGATSRVTPVVKDGLMFVTAGARVYALNPKTGERIWEYQDRLLNPAKGFTPSTTTDLGVPNTQGVAVGEGLVFVTLLNGHVIALEEKTGKPFWNVDLRTPPIRRTQRSSAVPIYANGMVFCSLATLERYVGQVMALDAKTGKELWRFQVIPGPGEAGHETWPQNSDIWKQGGGNPWLPPAVDPDLGLVYWGTGNANPLYVGEVRPGDNLYTASVIALDMKTGKLRWHYQVMHHDIWESDIATPLILYDAQADGRTRKAIAAMRPDGYLFVLDAETGKPLVPVEERPVPQDPYAKTSPTQPYPVGEESILSDCSTWKDKIPAGFTLECGLAPYMIDPKNILALGFGVRFEPMSFSPQTGYFYAQGQNYLEWHRRTDDPEHWNQGFPGRRVPGLARVASTIMAAVDSRTGKIVWRKEMAPVGGFGSGGSLSTAGGLLFHRNASDGNFEAYDAKSGDLLWYFQTGRAGGDASAMSYEVDGRQFVAVIEGFEVWSFRLGGTFPPREAPKLPLANTDPFTGNIQDTNRIETSALDQEDLYNSGTRYYVDDYAFNPYRARVKVGAPVTFMNNGHQAHTIVAQDGSWTTGTLQPREDVTMTFDKPGAYVYICKEHPFSYGQLIVVADSAGSTSAAPPADSSNQVQRGKAAYVQHCSSCHMADLSGSGEAAPALAGSAFLLRWQGRSASDLFDKTRTTMPTGSPATLTQEQYLDIIAYILQVNEFPAVEEINRDALKTVALTK
jgi:quinohemoprotein ethanol dehydrogenase